MCPRRKVKNAASVLRHSALSWWESLDPFDKPQTWNDMKLLMRETFVNPPPILTWTPLLASFSSIPCAKHGHMHGVMSSSGYIKLNTCINMSSNYS